MKTETIAETAANLTEQQCNALRIASGEKGVGRAGFDAWIELVDLGLMTPYVKGRAGDLRLTDVGRNVHAALVAEHRDADSPTETQRLTTAIEGVRRLCQQYTPQPPPLLRGPGLSEHGMGYNAGTRDIAQAILSTLLDALHAGPLCTNCDRPVVRRDDMDVCVGCGEETAADANMTAETGK